MFGYIHKLKQYIHNNCINLHLVFTEFIENFLGMVSKIRHFVKAKERGGTFHCMCSTENLVQQFKIILAVFQFHKVVVKAFYNFICFENKILYKILHVADAVHIGTSLTKVSPFNFNERLCNLFRFLFTFAAIVSES